MPVSDYDHWNEEAPLVWWAEEGRHQDVEPDEPDDDWRGWDEEED